MYNMWYILLIATKEKKVYPSLQGLTSSVGSILISIMNAGKTFVEMGGKLTLSKMIIVPSFTFTIEEQTCASSSTSKPVITVKIGGISRDVLLDFGLACNLIRQDNFIGNLSSKYQTHR